MGECDAMTRRGRRRGVFEGPPRALYGRTGARYVDACALAIVVNGVVISVFGVVTGVLYVDVQAGELALFAACSAAAYLAEGLAAAVHFRRGAAPVRVWLAGDRREEAGAQAWSVAAA